MFKKYQEYCDKPSGHSDNPMVPASWNCSLMERGVWNEKTNKYKMEKSFKRGTMMENKWEKVSYKVKHYMAH